MEKSKNWKLWVIISIIIIIVMLTLIVILYNNNNKLRKVNNEINGINKKSISAETFRNFIERENFDINDSKEAVSEEELSKASVKQAYLTKNIEDKEYRINFFEFKDENSEQYMYYDAINTIRNESNWNMTETIEKSMKHAKYAAVTNGNYIVVSRIDNTLIWATIDVNKKQELIELLNKIGY
jgi:predicted Holliday junction resolvase-like endonuclease